MQALERIVHLDNTWSGEADQRPQPIAKKLWIHFLLVLTEEIQECHSHVGHRCGPACGGVAITWTYAVALLIKVAEDLPPLNATQLVRDVIDPGMRGM